MAQKFFEKLKNKSGASMIEVVTFLGILAVITVAATTQMSQSAQQVAGMEREQAFAQLISQLQLFSNSHALCTGTLGGLPPPATNNQLIVNTGGLNLQNGTIYQNGLLKINSLIWSNVINLSPTESVGYLAVQADISDGNGTVYPGGNLRSFPTPGSNPPGILVDMVVDGGTNTVVGCGIPDPDGTTLSFQVPFPVTHNDSSFYSGNKVLPQAYPDNNYVIVCNMMNPQATAHFKNYGQFVPTLLTPTSFNWMYWQERGNNIPDGTQLLANCITHHN